MVFKTIAIFGSTGQVGRNILQALLDCEKQKFHVIQVVLPSEKDATQRAPNTEAKVIDINALGKDEISAILRGVEVVISALNGKGLQLQPKIQDAAAAAGVKRFYPSEYGMHHIYRRPGDDEGRIHPLWNEKDIYNEKALHHDAVKHGKMSYTLIGCGDFYNQEREKTWCPWSQTGVDRYDFHIVKDADAKVDFTHLRDLGDFLVETLCSPKVSENATLNVVSDHISHNEIAALLVKHSGKPVEKHIISEKDMHDYVANPSMIPKDLSAGSIFPAEFWLLVKGIQGQGRFWRPRGQVHNYLFPDFKTRPFEGYFQAQFS